VNKLPKVWEYEIGTKVQINYLAKGISDSINKTGEIIHKHEGILWDYDVLLDHGSVVRVRESELYRIKE
jgi:hypothetical protein